MFYGNKVKQIKNISFPLNIIVNLSFEKKQIHVEKTPKLFLFSASPFINELRKKGEHYWRPKGYDSPGFEGEFPEKLQH